MYDNNVDGSLIQKDVVFTNMDETLVNRHHNRGFTWKRIIDMEGYADEEGKVNKLPVCYDGDMDLPTGKGETLFILHYSKPCLQYDYWNTYC